MSNIALIPARGGSKRIPGKNTRDLAGHPLIAYTICAALDSGTFHKVLVSSDDKETLSIAASYGADCLRRPEEYATDTSPDIEWVRHALGTVIKSEFEDATESIRLNFDTFAILRPTSPFRKPETIRRAFHKWNTMKDRADSLRAVEKCSQHPAKCWQIVGDIAVPLMMQPQGTPFHSQQYAALPPVYIQNASLEIAHVRTVIETGTIAGSIVAPFFTEGDEGLDVNTERDWQLAEYLIDSGAATLPNVQEAAFV